MTALLIGAPLLWGFIALLAVCLCRAGGRADRTIEGWRNDRA